MSDPSTSSSGHNGIGRRDFTKRMVAMLAAMEVSLETTGVGRLHAQEALHPSGSVPPVPADPIIGIQMSPHTMLDQGIETCLDFIQETAALNMVMPYTHAFHASTLGKPLDQLAPDRPTTPRDFRGRAPSVWVRHNSTHPRLEGEGLLTRARYTLRCIAV